MYYKQVIHAGSFRPRSQEKKIPTSRDKRFIHAKTLEYIGMTYIIQTDFKCCKQAGLGPNLQACELGLGLNVDVLCKAFSTQSHDQSLSIEDL